MSTSAARRAGCSDGLAAEVDAGDRRAEARPRERVQPEVALQVEEGLTLDAADLLAFVIHQADRLAAVPEGIDVVELRPDVDLGPRVPNVAIAA